MEISKVLDPIGDGGGGGSDVRYDPLFDALQSEVEKLTCPSFTGIVDWEGVVELASDILATKSKDLVVTGYLAVALVHTRHQDGVLTSLRVYHDMLAKFWDELYPPKLKARGRVLAVEWWLEKTLKALQLRRVRLSRQQAFAAQEVVERIDRLLTERLPGAPPVEPLKRLFAEQQHEATEERAMGTAAAPVPVAGSGGVKHGTEEEAVAAPGKGEGARDLEGALQRLRREALLLRLEDPADPVAYRLVRLSVWTPVSLLPPALEGRTRIPPPHHDQAALLRELRQKRSAQALLDAAEGRVSQFLFWLDLNRLSFEALGHLGDRFRDAQEAVAQETCHFVARLPSLMELCFSDGTPFADAETRRWLQQRFPATQLGAGGGAVGVALAEMGAPEDTPDVPGGESGAELARAVAEAQRLAQEGKLSEAVDALHCRLEGCRSGRERLIWRLALVEFLLQATGSRLILPQLEAVLADVERHALTRYDPALALRALKLAYVGFQSVDDPVMSEKAREALFRIGELDPAEMVRLEKGARVC